MSRPYLLTKEGYIAVPTSIHNKASEGSCWLIFHGTVLLASSNLKKQEFFMPSGAMLTWGGLRYQSTLSESIVCSPDKPLLKTSDPSIFRVESPCGIHYTDFYMSPELLIILSQWDVTRPRGNSANAILLGNTLVLRKALEEALTIYEAGVVHLPTSDFASMETFNVVEAVVSDSPEAAPMLSIHKCYGSVDRYPILGRREFILEVL